MKININNVGKVKNKDLIVFDLDGTIVETKSPMEREMSKLIEDLLAVKKVAIIGGGKYGVFKNLFLHRLKAPKNLLKNLFLFPTTSTSFYRYHHGWKKIYALNLSKQEVSSIKKAFREVFKEINYVQPEKIYGKVIENRGTQVTFSALGQDVVTMLGKKGVLLKGKWKRENTPIKMKIAGLVAKRLPGLEVHAAGFTSIDVTKKGIDKAYGMRQIQKHLKIPIAKMLFIGDAIFPGGNDYAVVRTGIDYMPVKGPQETKKIICHLLIRK
jgi:hypothetical protein